MTRPAARRGVSGAELLQLAITAHGGLTALEQSLAAFTTESRGTFYGQPFRRKTHWKAPDGAVIEIRNGALVMAFVGKQCWNVHRKLVFDCMGSDLESSKGIRLMSHWLNLYPLKGTGVRIGRAPSRKVGGRDAEGITVSTTDRKFGAEIHFDKQTHLMVRAAYRWHWNRQSGLIETLLSNHRKVQQIRLPFRRVTSFRGKPILREEITKVTLGRVTKTLFSRPPQASFGQPATATVEAHHVAFIHHRGKRTLLGRSEDRLRQWVRKHRLFGLGMGGLAFLKAGGARQLTEIFLPVAVSGLTPQSTASLGIKKIPKTTIAYSFEQGPTLKLEPRFAALRVWIKEQQLKIVGPPMVICHSDSDKVKPARWVNQIFYRVQKQSP